MPPLEVLLHFLSLNAESGSTMEIGIFFTLAGKYSGMYYILVSLVIGLFVAMLFLNVYFRVKVMKSYKKLVQNEVEFNASHLFNKKKMEEEVFPKYPNMKGEIEIFSNHLRYSIRMATVLIALITLFGAILMYYR